MPRRLRLALFCALLTLAGGALANGARDTPAMLEQRATEWKMQGDADMRWLGLRIYNASLWVPADSGWKPDAPFALEIRYARSIKSSRLVDVSLEEMQRLQVAEPGELEAWRASLEAAFPDVERDDTIVGLREADGSVSFYHRGQPTVSITDPRFARAFFAIWFDERTRAPAVRQRLLGLANAD